MTVSRSVCASVLAVLVVVALGSSVSRVLRPTADDMVGRDGAERDGTAYLRDPRPRLRGTGRPLETGGMQGTGVNGRSLAQEWAVQHEALREALRKARFVRSAEHPVLDRLDHLVGILPVQLDVSQKQIVDLRLARAATTLALIGSGGADREDRGFTPWLDKARELALRDLDSRRPAWASRTTQAEAAWIADLFLVWGLVAQFGEPGGARLRKTSARALDSLLASERGSGGYGPGRGTFAATWLAAMTLACARAHAVKHRRLGIRGKGSEERAFYDPELAESAIRRAARFLDAYADDDGLVSLPKRDQGWFSLGSAPVGENSTLGPTGAVYLIRYLSGERVHRSADMERGASWIAAHLPEDWREARRRDPLGMYAVPLFLVQTKEYEHLRTSFMEKHGRARHRAAGPERRPEGARSGSTSEPAHRIALAALANDVFNGDSRLMSPR